MYQAMCKTLGTASVIIKQTQPLILPLARNSKEITTGTLQISYVYRTDIAVMAEQRHRKLQVGYNLFSGVRSRNNRIRECTSALHLRPSQLSQ